MKEFMYIFRGSVQNEEAFIQLSPEQMQAEMQKWNVWMGDLAQRGKLISGQPLLPHGKVLKGVSKKITDGPFTEGKDIVGIVEVIREAYPDPDSEKKGDWVQIDLKAEKKFKRVVPLQEIKARTKIQSSAIFQTLK